MSTWITRAAALLFVAAMLALAGCNSSSTGGFTGDPDNGDGNGDNGDGVTGADIGRVVVTGSNTLPTGNDTRLQLEVLVLDDANRVKEGVEVFPQTDDRDLFFEAAGTSGWQTDESGRVRLYVRTPANPENRTSSLTVRADGETSPPFPVQVTGTAWSPIQATSTATINAFETLQLALRDSTGGTLGQRPVNAEGSGDAVIVDPTEGETDLSGTFSVDYQANDVGDFHVLVSSSGAQYQHSFSVDQFGIEFIEPDESGGLWPVGTDIDVTVQLMEGNTPMEGEEIRFNASRGSLDGSDPPQVTTTTDDDGKATVIIRSDDVGPTRITAKALDVGVETSTTAQFVTDAAEFIDLQAVPAIVRPRDTENASDAGDDSVSRIVAKVTDDAGQPVQGAEVGFNLSDTSGGELRSNTATTDLFGRAVVEYVAGRVGSGDQGITVTGFLTEDTDLSNQVKLTASAQALYITLGTGNEILDINETTYAKPYTAVITDASGQPVANTEVSLSVWSTDYRRGFLVWSDDAQRWVIHDSAVQCASEDQTRGGNINLENDVSETGTLLPGNVATLAPADGTELSITTDESGFADFEVRYPKDHAQWVRVELRATVGGEVAGTEGERLRSFWLPVADDDVNELDTLPPGYNSPFGTGRPGEADRCTAFPEDYDWQESFRDEFL
ncbi:hypothetical protein ACN2MM_14600 [Alkalilimnicola ehrlichii MLHE-1]|uniref:Ig domain protein, group 1 domain protein n=1 Tax=Alkalilimnicola ehrlichii (strain ATCC BAA-1101 / DSM 17681 / MLHE-1) TaxID=187272 RepID=Q0A4Y7_ALKEH|nr:Ig domain-containing protein [Alkalilimnicola ehrlichii]ABI58100.1 Ig domain protein, group 1 domain protein [Alkalilimnicola ehrlichii MLHE-1]